VPVSSNLAVSWFWLSRTDPAFFPVWQQIWQQDFVNGRAAAFVHDGRSRWRRTVGIARGPVERPLASDYERHLAKPALTDDRVMPEWSNHWMTGPTAKAWRHGRCCHRRTKPAEAPTR
jgi:hypothetical protein